MAAVSVPSATFTVSVPIAACACATGGTSAVAVPGLTPPAFSTFFIRISKSETVFVCPSKVFIALSKEATRVLMLSSREVIFFSCSFDLSVTNLFKSSIAFLIGSNGLCASWYLLSSTAAFISWSSTRFARSDNNFFKTSKVLPKESSIPLTSAIDVVFSSDAIFDMLVFNFSSIPFIILSNSFKGAKLSLTFFSNAVNCEFSISRFFIQLERDFWKSSNSFKTSCDPPFSWASAFFTPKRTKSKNTLIKNTGSIPFIDNTPFWKCYF